MLYNELKIILKKNLQTIQFVRMTSEDYISLLNLLGTPHCMHIPLSHNVQFTLQTIPQPNPQPTPQPTPISHFHHCRLNNTSYSSTMSSTIANPIIVNPTTYTRVPIV